MLKIKMTYDCGRCGNVQIRTYESVNGLLTVPTVYCGKCVRQKQLTTMSSVISEVTVLDGKATESKATVPGLVGCVRGPEKQPAGQASQPEAGGWVSADKTPGKIGPTGAGNSSGVPGMAQGQGLPGGQIK